MVTDMEASNKDAKKKLASGDCAGVFSARHVEREATGTWETRRRPRPAGRGSDTEPRGKVARCGGGSQTAP